MDAVQALLGRHVQMHMQVAVQLAGLPRRGAYKFSEVEDYPDFVGSISEDGLNGSVRYGEALAVPDQRGVVHFAYIGAGRSKSPHLVVGSLMPEDAYEEVIHAELEAMHVHHRKEFRDPAEFRLFSSGTQPTGPHVDLDRSGARDYIGKIDRWFHTELTGSDRVKVGDFLEANLRDGPNKGSRVRVEATESGFLAMVGTRGEEDEDVQDWKMVWSSHTLSGCLEFLISSPEEREEHVYELIYAAQKLGGAVRYLNGSLYGVVPVEEGVYVIKNWVPVMIYHSLEDGAVVNKALDVRQILGLDIEVV